MAVAPVVESVFGGVALEARKPVGERYTDAAARGWSARVAAPAGVPDRVVSRRVAASSDVTGGVAGSW